MNKINGYTEEEAKNLVEYIYLIIMDEYGKAVGP